MSSESDESYSYSSASEDDDDSGYANPMIKSRPPIAAASSPMQHHHHHHARQQQQQMTVAMTRSNIPRSIVGRQSNQLLSKVAASLRGRKPDTVTYKFDINVPFSVLQKQADGGKLLRLRIGDGIEPGVHYSNPLHAKPEVLALGDIDILCGEAVLRQTNSLGKRLLVGTSIPLPYSPTHAILDINSKSKDAPYGRLAFDAPHNEDTKVERILTDEQRDFVDKYPGQTVDDFDNFMYDAPADKDGDMHVQLVPRAAVLHFYENMDEVKQDKKLQIDWNKIDAKGRGYINKEYAVKAREIGKEQVLAGIGYCNVSNPKKLEITVAMPYENTRHLTMTDGVEKSITSKKQPRLIDAFRAAGMAAINKIQEENNVAVKKSLIENGSFHFHGTLTLPYFKVDKNFEYV